MRRKAEIRWEKGKVPGSQKNRKLCVSSSLEDVAQDFPQVSGSRQSCSVMLHTP